MNEDLKATTRNNHQRNLSSVNLQVDEENWLLEAADLTGWIKILEVVRAVLLGCNSCFGVIPAKPAVPRAIAHRF